MVDIRMLYLVRTLVYPETSDTDLTICH